MPAPLVIANANLEGTLLDGRYRLDHRIGSGGVGAVYRAQSLQGGPTMAVKVLLPRHDFNYTHQRRFMREARVASLIVHPNVMRVVDFGQSPTGRTYSVMEYLPGEDLGKRLKREGPMSWAAVRPILQQVIRGLQAAHELGVLHRDIKPSNVYLVEGREGHDDHVKLLDFGLAKAVDPGSSLAEGLTMADEIMGTAQYLAPERILGDPADARSDLYSLGVMAFRMLSGTLPRWGDDVGKGAQGLLQRTRQPPPSLREVMPDVDPAIEALVLDAMAVDPEDRFSSLRHLEHAMLRIPVEGQPEARVHATSLRYADGPTQSVSVADADELEPTLSIAHDLS